MFDILGVLNIVFFVISMFVLVFISCLLVFRFIFSLIFINVCEFVFVINLCNFFILFRVCIINFWLLKLGFIFISNIIFMLWIILVNIVIGVEGFNVIVVFILVFFICCIILCKCI